MFITYITCVCIYIYINNQKKHNLKITCSKTTHIVAQVALF